jgi:GTP-binding protein
MLTVAIVGRPNVGKSALFNRLAGRRIAIVDETSGVTRDRLYTTIEWFGTCFQLIDTGGLVSDPDQLESFIERQAAFALEEADLLLFTVDGQAGRTSLDDVLVEKLRKASKPVWIVVTKIDNDALATAWTEFAGYGWGSIFSVSALHNRGITELLDALEQAAAGKSEEAEQEGAATAIAIVGRPNAGKSSLVNCLTGDERSIVSDIPGTTRDAVDVRMTWQYARDGHEEEKNIILIDTAGIKRRRTVSTKLDAYSIHRAEIAIKRASVAVLLLDATAGITVTDKKIANTIADAGTGCVIGINKWDLMQGKTSRSAFRDWVFQELPFLTYAPLIFISAKTGNNVPSLVNKACDVDLIGHETVTTGVLNRVVSQAFEQHPPPLIRGRRLKLYYATQTGTAPPRFLLFVNDPQRVKQTYTSYLVGRLRAAFGFEGSPIILNWRSRSKND